MKRCCPVLLVVVLFAIPSAALGSTSTVALSQVSGQAGAVAVSAQSHVYVLAARDSKIYEYDDAGALLASAGPYMGRAWDTQLGDHASAIAVDSSGEVFIAQDNAPVIIELNPDLSYGRTLSAGGHYVSLAADGADLYAMVSSAGTYTLQRFAGAVGPPAASHAFTFGSGAGDLAAGDDDPQIAVGPDGVVYVVDTGNHRVIELSSGLAPLSATFSIDLTDFTDQPVSITTGGSVIAPAGTVELGGVQAGHGAAIENYFGGRLSGTVLGSVEGDFADLAGLAGDPAGNLFAGVTGAGNAVQRIDVTPDPVLAASPPSAVVGQTVTFDTTGTKTDLWGLEGYRWDFDNSGTYATDGLVSPTFTHVFTLPGAYNVSLEVFPFDHRNVKTTIPYIVTPVAAPPLVGGASVSINGGASYTRSVNVKLSLTAPAGDNAALIANNASALNAQSVALAPTVAWRLLGPTTSEKTLRTVGVVFSPSGLLRSASIILDSVSPIVGKTSVTVSGAKLTIHLAATDNVSGLAAYEVTTSRAKPGRHIPFTAKVVGRRTLSAALTVKNATAHTLYLRLLDRAGNVSAWHTLHITRRKARH